MLAPLSATSDDDPMSAELRNRSLEPTIPSANESPDDTEPISGEPVWLTALAPPELSPATEPPSPPLNDVPEELLASIVNRAGLPEAPPMMIAVWRIELAVRLLPAARERLPVPVIAPTC